jgi:hypothetical protein
MRAHGKPTPAEVARFMRLSARLFADHRTKLSRADECFVRRMLDAAGKEYGRETDLSIPEVRIEAAR